MRKPLTMLAAAAGFAAAIAVAPVSAAPISHSAALKSAVDSHATDVQFRRRGAQERSYFKRDCMGDYDSGGARC